MAAVLMRAKKPMKAQQLADAVLEGGYVTEADVNSLTKTIRCRLTQNKDRFECVSRGEYALKEAEDTQE